MNIPLYKRAASKLDKMILIRKVTEQVMDCGRVRFLRLAQKKIWKEVSFRTAQDKVSHALRDGISKPGAAAATRETTTTTSIMRITATEKKQIDPLALLAATSQMKLPLADLPVAVIITTTPTTEAPSSSSSCCCQDDTKEQELTSENNCRQPSEAADPLSLQNVPLSDTTSEEPQRHDETKAQGLTSENNCRLPADERAATDPLSLQSVLLPLGIKQESFETHRATDGTLINDDSEISQSTISQEGKEATDHR